ncbi:MAG: ATP-binding protein [Bacteroidia bacterium]|nr:ATP-binding protein [Bacteroidia bacterium]
MNEYNPFPISGYHGPELFCDREKETAKLITHIKNGINSTLISTRRMGKTGLIYHVFDSLKKRRDVECIYVDIFGTQNIKQLTNSLGTAIMRAIPEKKSIGKKFVEYIKGFKPTISFDGITGEPEVSIDFSSPEQAQHSLASLFSFLEQQNITVVVAIDEFQQVTEYPEKNTEAILRTIIQPLKNVRFIFSGSGEHILTEMFNSYKRPFFSSTQVVSLKEIESEVYMNFILKTLAAHKRKINRVALEYITTWTRLHTYYTQTFCNRIFYSGIKNIGLEEVKTLGLDLLNDQESVFYQYRNLLTANQWQLLNAIAKEDRVFQPNSKDFIKKYDLGSQGNVQRALEALLTKDMVFKGRNENENFYRVSDCFLARWLERH